MNVLKKLKQILYSACLYFTAAEFLILIIASAFNNIAPENGGTAGKFLSLGSAALIFAACIIVAALNLVWRLDYSISVRVLLHFVGCLIAWIMITIIIPGVYTDIAQIIVRSLIFAVLYLVIAFIVFIINSIKKNRNTEDLEYEPKFGNFFDK